MKPFCKSCGAPAEPRPCSYCGTAPDPIARFLGKPIYDPLEAMRLDVLYGYRSIRPEALAILKAQE